MPLPGFVHLIDVYRLEDGYDAAGGTSQTPVIQLSSLWSRISILTGEDELKGFGNISGRRWAVSVEGAPDIRRSDYLKVAGNSIPTPMNSGFYLEVRYVKQQINDLGAIHHTLVYAEEVDE